MIYNEAVLKTRGSKIMIKKIVYADMNTVSGARYQVTQQGSKYIVNRLDLPMIIASCENIQTAKRVINKLVK